MNSLIKQAHEQFKKEKPVTADLREQLDGAQYIKTFHVPETSDEIAYAWFGGHGVHVYDTKGEEIDFWNVGDFDQPEADIGEVEQAVEEHMNELMASKSDGLEKKALGTYLSEMAEDIIAHDDILEEIKDAIESGIDIETAINEVVDNYLNINFGADVFQDYSDEAVMDFMSMVASGIREKLE
jgi:hypothetical protein